MKKFKSYISEQTPPGYKQADYGKSCLNCKYLDSRSNHCTKYHVPVSTNYVCLSWERGDPLKSLTESIKRHHEDNFYYMINPSKTQIKQYIKKYENDELRYVYDGRDFYVWDSMYHIHNAFCKSLGIRLVFGGYITEFNNKLDLTLDYGRTHDLDFESIISNKMGFENPKRDKNIILLEKVQYAGPYDYIENPSFEEFMKFLNKTYEKELRFAMSKDRQSFFVWDANKAEHNEFRMMYHQNVDSSTFDTEARKWYYSTGVFVKDRRDTSKVNLYIYNDGGFNDLKKLMKKLRYDMSRFDEGAYFRNKGMYLKESVSESELEAFRMKLAEKYTPSRLYLWITRNGDLKLDTIVFNKDKQKQGRGTALMQELVDWADKKGLRIVLTPSDRNSEWGTTSASRLKTFYKRFEFVENKGRNKDYRISDSMYRNPQ